MNDGLDQLPEDVRALLRAEKAHIDVPDDARARLAERMAIGVPGFAPPLVPAPSAAPAGGMAVGGSLKVLLIALALGAGGAVAAHRAGAPPSGSDHRAQVPGRVRAPHAPRMTVEEPDVTRAAPPSALTIAPPPPAPPLIGDDGLREERRLLDDARDAITRGEPERALAPTASYAVRFPRGVLAEERDALRVRALARLGRKGEAGALLERMRAAHPQSFLLEGAAEDVEAIP